MSEQATMTREQLEAAGSIFGMVANMPLQRFVEMPDGAIYSRDTIEALCEDATAHYRQQQELAALREFKQLVWTELHATGWASGNRKDKELLGVRVMRHFDNCFDESVMDMPPTVSESERAE